MGTTPSRVLIFLASRRGYVPEERMCFWACLLGWSGLARCAVIEVVGDAFRDFAWLWAGPWDYTAVVCFRTISECSANACVGLQIAHRISRSCSRAHGYFVEQEYVWRSGARKWPWYGGTRSSSSERGEGGRGPLPQGIFLSCGCASRPCSGGAHVFPGASHRRMDGADAFLDIAWN